MKTIICEKNKALEKAADIICSRLAEKPDTALALACGETMVPLWEKLAGRCAEGACSFTQARILCVTEYCGVPYEKSCRRALTAGLVERTDAQAENVFFPDPETPEETDRRIEAFGGLDLAVLGIGENCHIGYNEPGTLFDSRTHVQKLTERTRKQLLKRGFSEADVPETAVTMGIKTLTDSRKILLLAFGEEKAAAVFQMLYAKTTSYIPAAYLQIPLQVTVLLDGAAAEKL
jgi:glucosamine-6-phosphate deaminase